MNGNIEKVIKDDKEFFKIPLERLSEFIDSEKCTNISIEKGYAIVSKEDFSLQEKSYPDKFVSLAKDIIKLCEKMKIELTDTNITLLCNLSSIYVKYDLSSQDRKELLHNIMQIIVNDKGKETGKVINHFKNILDLIEYGKITPNELKQILTEISGFIG